jgi:hypothetical protein
MCSVDFVLVHGYVDRAEKEMGFFPHPLELVGGRGGGMVLPLGLIPYPLLHINLLLRCGKYFCS